VNKGVVISIALALVFLLYFPVLGNGFLTDDYAALYRLLIQKRVLFEGMVRPLIDISFYFNYLISGLHPVGYYIFNLCIHALVCCMVYQVTLDLPMFSGRRQQWFALTAGFLFLFYPFHNEGVVWLSGRLSSLAALFGLMAIHFAMGTKRPWNMVLAVVCWWVGLFAYESIIVAPAAALVFEWIKYRDMRRGLRSASAWVAAGVLWLGMRYLAAGTILPGYANGGLAGDPPPVRFVKVLGRCFLPPEENSKLLTIFFVGVVVIIGIVSVLAWRRLGWLYVLLGSAFLLSLLPAVAFEVSTRTSEGDRLLYFPSCMLCLLASAVVFAIVPGGRWRLLLGGGYVVASVVFVIGVDRNWVFASRTAESALDLVRRSRGRVVLVNAPDEWEGAYIFRNNFNEGLVVNGIDTNRVTVTHVLTRLEYLKAPAKIEPVVEGGQAFIYPATRIDTAGAGRMLYYWDMYGWKRLILH
jgi:hypothetical protein